MKRIAILLPLVAGLAMPLAAFSAPAAPAVSEVSELPWSTVSKVLERVTDVWPYSYAQLVDWYQVGRVTVEQVGSGYRVTALNDDGILEITVLEGA